MVLDEEKKKQILEVFKTVAEYRELAKGHNSTASDNMKGLVESLSEDKQERKTLRKVLSKAYKEWIEEQRGEEETITEALEVLEMIKE